MSMKPRQDGNERDCGDWRCQYLLSTYYIPGTYRNSTQRCSIDKDSEAPENLRPALTSYLRGLSAHALAPLWTPVFPLMATWNRDDSREEKGHRMSFLQRHLNATPSDLNCFSDVPLICRPSSESLSWPGSSSSALLSTCASHRPFLGPRVILMSTPELHTCDFLCLDTSPLPFRLTPGLLLFIHLPQLKLTFSGCPPWSSRGTSWQRCLQILESGQMFNNY